MVVLQYKNNTTELRLYYFSEVIQLLYGFYFSSFTFRNILIKLLTLKQTSAQTKLQYLEIQMEGTSDVD